MPKGKLPDAARVLPKAGQSLWLRAFNDALDQGMPEDDASKVAWAEVKRAGYSKKVNGKWGKSMEFDFTLNEDGTFMMGAPIMKIDVAKRIVGGFATLNNVDEAKDLVEADASQEAFSEWYGNIREMHEKKAVGKAIDWKPDVYVDKDGTEYSGIWVRAKISKGAEDTWQKVLDGTLSGFSIGGATLEKQRDLVKNNDGTAQQIWRITKYRLTELSLVDSPCNRLASISLIKSVDGGIEVDDTVADGNIEKGELQKDIHAPGDSGCCEPEIQAVLDALSAWRQSEIDEEDDYAVSRVSDIMANVRSYMQAEMYEHSAQAIQNVLDGNDDETDDDSTMLMSADGKAAAQELRKRDLIAAQKKKGAKEGETMEKSEETLQDKEISDTNSVEQLSEAEKNVFRKFIDFIKGNEVSKKEETLNNDKEGEEPEMNTEDVTKAISDAGEVLTKGVDDKFTAVGESLTKIAEALEKVATAEAVAEFKTELKTEIDALTERMTTLENSGAIKKSGEDAGKTGAETKIEKGEGFWGNNILPEFLVK